MQYPKGVKYEPYVNSDFERKYNVKFSEVENRSTISTNVIRYNVSFDVSEMPDKMDIMFKEVPNNLSITFTEAFKANRNTSSLSDKIAPIIDKSKPKIFWYTDPKPIKDGKTSFQIMINGSSPVDQESIYNIQLGGLTINGEPVAIPFFKEMLKFVKDGTLGRIVGLRTDSPNRGPYYFNYTNSYTGTTTPGFFNTTVKNFLASPDSKKVTTFNESGENAGLKVTVAITDIKPFPGLQKSGFVPTFWSNSNNLGASTFNTYTVTIENITQPIKIGGSVIPSSQCTNYIFYNDALEPIIRGYREKKDDDPSAFIWANSNQTINEEGKLYSKYLYKNPKNKNNYVKLTYKIPNGYKFAYPIYDYLNGKYDKYIMNNNGQKLKPLPSDWVNIEENGLFQVLNGKKTNLPYDFGYFINYLVPNTAMDSGEVRTNNLGNNRKVGYVQLATTTHIAIYPELMTYNLNIDRTNLLDYPVQKAETFKYDVKYKNIINIPTEIPKSNEGVFQYWILEAKNNKNGYNARSIVYPGDSIDISDEKKITLNNEYGAEGDVATNLAQYVTSFELSPVFAKDVNSRDIYDIYYAKDDNGNVGELIESIKPVPFYGIPGFYAVLRNDAPAIMENINVNGVKLEYKGSVVRPGTLLTSEEAEKIQDYMPITLLYGSNDISITFKTANGQEGINKVLNDSITIPVDSSLKSNNKEIPTVNINDNYELEGWYKDGDKSQTIISNSEILDNINSENITYIAKIKRKEEKVTFTTKEDDPAVKIPFKTSIIVPKGLSISGSKKAVPTIPSENINEYYEQNGWTTNSEPNNILSNETIAKAVVNEDITYIANLVRKQAKVTFQSTPDEVGISTPLNSSVDVPMGSNIDENDIPSVEIKNGYHISGWHIEGDEQNTIITTENLPKIVVDKNITIVPVIIPDLLKVQFTTNNNPGTDSQVDITYDVNYNESLLKSGKTVPSITDINKDYTFEGWFNSKDPNQVVVSDDSILNTPILQNTIYVAKITRKKVKITFDIDNTSAYVDENKKSAVIEVPMGMSLASNKNTIPNITYNKEEYEFLGWYYEDNKIDDTEILNNINNENITYVGKFKRLTYNVTFTLPDGQKGLVEPFNDVIETVPSGESISSSGQSVPNLENIIDSNNYTFKGWIDSKNPDVILSPQDIENSKVTSSITYVGYIVRKKVYITFKTPTDSSAVNTPVDNNYSIGKGSSLSENGISVPIVETNEGYKFLGWANQINPDVPLSSESISAIQNNEDTVYIPVFQKEDGTIDKGTVEPPAEKPNNDEPIENIPNKDNDGKVSIDQPEPKPENPLPVPGKEEPPKNGNNGNEPIKEPSPTPTKEPVKPVPEVKPVDNKPVVAQQTKVSSKETMFKSAKTKDELGDKIGLLTSLLAVSGVAIIGNKRKH